MFIRVFAILIVWLLSTTTASAQVNQRSWTPWEQDPTCLISENHFTTPEAKSYGSSAASMILQWYVWGDDFISNVHTSNVYDFTDCFVQVDCGLSRNSAVARYLHEKNIKGVNGMVKPSAEVIAYFSKKPPPEAIKYAAKGVGKCFGADSEGFSLQDLGLVRVDAPLKACKAVRNKISSPWINKAPYKIDKHFSKISEVYTWGSVVGSLIGYNAPLPSKPVESCSVAPAILAPILAEVALSDITSEERAQMEAEAKRLRLTNRTDAERFRGLNGCQIAYSLVYQGINSRDRTVGFISDEAITWALQYEKANLSGLACPVIPDSLSDWVQKQPIALFQAEPDPYTEFRSRKGPGSGSDYNSWVTFAEIWMSRYETQQVASGREGSDCDALLYYTRSDRFRPTNEDNGPSAFVSLSRLSYKSEAGAAMCAFAPVSMVSSARKYYDAEQARKRRAIEDEMKKRQPVIPATLPKQNYLWKNTPSTRCYWAGDTKYGQKNVCFTS